MTSPRIQDKDGRELSVGAKVERVFANGKTGGMVGMVDAIERGGRFWVTWNQRTQLRSPFYGQRRPLQRSYHCPDLKLITDQEKEKK